MCKMLFLKYPLPKCHPAPKRPPTDANVALIKGHQTQSDPPFSSSSEHRTPGFLSNTTSDNFFQMCPSQPSAEPLWIPQQDSDTPLTHDWLEDLPSASGIWYSSCPAAIRYL